MCVSNAVMRLVVVLVLPPPPPQVISDLRVKAGKGPMHPGAYTAQASMAEARDSLASLKHSPFGPHTTGRFDCPIVVGSGGGGGGVLPPCKRTRLPYGNDTA